MQRIVYICDDCGEEYECSDGLGFKDAWQEAKDEGWKCYCNEGEWVHKCSECQ